MSRKVRPLETCGASRCTTNRRGTKVPVLHFAAPRPTQPADALTSENRLKGVALDRLHRRLIDAPANNNPAGTARTASHGSASLFIFFLRPGALATIPMCIKAPRRAGVGTYPRQHYRAYAARDAGCTLHSLRGSLPLCPRDSPSAERDWKKFRESTHTRTTCSSLTISG